MPHCTESSDCPANLDTEHTALMLHAITVKRKIGIRRRAVNKQQTSEHEVFWLWEISLPVYSSNNPLNFFSLSPSYTQFVICKRKLESKKEALLILSKELDTCQQERDQYKLMANQLRERHQGLKKKYRELIVSHPCATQRCFVAVIIGEAEQRI